MKEHSLAYFGFCPHCGSARFEPVEPRAKKCGSCGFVFYMNPAAAVAAMIVDDCGRLLLTRRKNEPAKGTWDLPGGFAEFDETLEGALKREIREELGVELLSMKYFASFPNLYPFSGIEVHTLDSFFLAKLNDDDLLIPADDVDGFKWVDLHNVILDEIGLPSIRMAIQKLCLEYECF